LPDAQDWLIMLMPSFFTLRAGVNKERGERRARSGRVCENFSTGAIAPVESDSRR
jgi:hypothetical protein